jgi:osmotically inducible protein OsmC
MIRMCIVEDGGGKPCGIVTDRDIILRAVAEGRDPSTRPLSAACSSNLETLSPEDTLDRAVELARRERNELFAIAYAACFESALRSAARNHGKEAKDANVTARVTLMRNDAAGFQLKVELQGQIPGLSKQETEELLQAAHQTCPYSKATRGNIEVTLVARDVLPMPQGQAQPAHASLTRAKMNMPANNPLEERNFQGPSLLALSIVHAALSLGGLGLVGSATRHAFVPSPLDGTDLVVIADRVGMLRLGAFLHFGAAAPLRSRCQ